MRRRLLLLLPRFDIVEGELPDLDAISIAQHLILDRCPVDVRSVRTVQILDGTLPIVVQNFCMLARHRLLVDLDDVPRTSADRDIGQLRTDIHRNFLSRLRLFEDQSRHVATPREVDFALNCRTDGRAGSPALPAGDDARPFVAVT